MNCSAGLTGICLPHSIQLLASHFADFLFASPDSREVIGLSTATGIFCDFKQPRRIPSLLIVSIASVPHGILTTGSRPTVVG
jgi:hypothetical protein